MAIVSIYSLSCPKSGEVKYIGKTGKGIEKRLKAHLCTNNNTKNSEWIKELKKEGLKPIIEEIDSVEKGNEVSEEKFYISYFRFLGFTLLNMNGGGQGSDHSEATRKKISIALTGIKRSDEQKSLLAYYNQIGVIGRKGHLHKESSKKKISEKLMGHSLSEKTKKTLVKVAISKRLPILQLSKEGDLIKEWESISKAAKELGLCKGHLIKCCKCRPHYKTIGGFKWKYKNT